MLSEFLTGHFSLDSFFNYKLKVQCKTCDSTLRDFFKKIKHCMYFINNVGLW